MTLRDELAAVLGPGNDDATAYAQADSVIDVLNKWDAEHSEAGDSAWDAAVERVRDAYPGWLIGSLSRLSSGVLVGIVEEAERVLHDRRVSGSFE
jgi:hypothetical protein